MEELYFARDKFAVCKLAGHLSNSRSRMPCECRGRLAAVERREATESGACLSLPILILAARYGIHVNIMRMPDYCDSAATRRLLPSPEPLYVGAASELPSWPPLCAKARRIGSP